MHLPDGMLSPAVAGAMIAAAGAAVAIASSRLRHILTTEMAPFIGVLGAFIFAAQNVKIPFGPWFAGHLDGGALIAILLGPSAGIVTIFAVLVVQLLLAADGGVLALGANTWNLGVADAVAAFAVYRLLAPRAAAGFRFYAAAALAAFAGVVAASFCCAAQIALSMPADRGVLFGTIVGVHAVIGAGEAALTVLCLRALRRLAPALFRESAAAARGAGAASLRSARREWISILLLSLLVGTVVAYFASSLPDGLEWSLSRHGAGASETPASAPFPGYSTPGIDSEFLARAIPIAIGVAAVTLLVAACVRLLRRRAQEKG